MADRVQCTSCENRILLITAEKNGGLCMVCWKKSKRIAFISPNKPELSTDGPLSPDKAIYDSKRRLEYCDLADTDLEKTLLSFADRFEEGLDSARIERIVEGYRKLEASQSREIQLHLIHEGVPCTALVWLKEALGSKFVTIHLPEYVLSGRVKYDPYLAEVLKHTQN